MEKYTSKREIKEIIIHCSATRQGKDFTASDIRRWHLERGFSDIGYHFVIRRDGTIERGRSLDKIGAHCLGHNRNSIGICYVGGLDSMGRPMDTRTYLQRKTLVELLRQLQMSFPNASIHGHCEFAAKACPCFDARSEYSSI